MTKIMNLGRDNYYTQNNNPTIYGDNPDIPGDKDTVVKAFVQCMPTAYVMFLIGNKISFNNSSSLPHDAFFTALLVTPAAWEFAKKKYGTLVADGYAPYEIHGMYGSYLSPIICGHRVSDFRIDLTFEDYIHRIRGGQVIMTSGQFANFAGHAFAAIGAFKSNQEDFLSIADPHGDFRTFYRSADGYGVTMSKVDFINHAKPVGKTLKYGHVII